MHLGRNVLERSRSGLIAASAVATMIGSRAMALDPPGETPECRGYRVDKDKTGGRWSADESASVYARGLLPAALECCRAYAESDPSPELDAVCTYATREALACRKQLPSAQERAQSGPCGDDARVADMLDRLARVPDKSTNLQRSIAALNASPMVNDRRLQQDYSRVNDCRRPEPVPAAQAPADLAKADDHPTDEYAACVCARMGVLERIAAPVPQSVRDALLSSFNAQNPEQLNHQMARAKQSSRDFHVKALVDIEFKRREVYRELTAIQSADESAPSASLTATVLQLEQQRASLARLANIGACLGSWNDAAQRVSALRDRAAVAEKAAEEARRCLADAQCREKHEQQERRAAVQELAESVCSEIAAKRDALAEVQRLHARGRRFGVVNLGDLDEAGDAVESRDEAIKDGKARYRELSGRAFSPRVCAQ
jgi:hypothetical protein